MDTDLDMLGNDDTVSTVSKLKDSECNESKSNELESSKIVGRRFPDAVTRIVKENHHSNILGLELCPFPGMSNLVVSVGSNQMNVYDCMHRGNYFDLVTNFYNKPDWRAKMFDTIEKKEDPNPTAKKNKFKYTKEEIEKVSFNDVCWILRNKNDIWIAIACNDGHVYVVSLIWSQCEVVFPASKRAIRNVLSYNDPLYNNKVIITIDDKYVTKLWNIDNLDLTHQKLTEKGDIINDQICESLLRMPDALTCLTLEISNDNSKKNTLLYGATLDGKIKVYEIDDGSNDDISNNNDNENQNQQKMAQKWQCKQISEFKIKNSKNNSYKILAMKWRPGEQHKNQMVFVDNNGKFWLFNTVTGQTMHKFDLSGGFGSLLFSEYYSFDMSKDGKYLVYGNGNGNIHVYSFDSKKIKLKRTHDRSKFAIRHARFAPPNEESFIVGSDSILWKYDTDQWVAKFSPTTSFFEDTQYFAQRVPAKDTYVDF